MKTPSKFPREEQELPGDQHEMTFQPVTMRENYKGSNKLKDKVALITGGDSGIGRAIAAHFACEGADVAISYYDEEEDARETREMVEAYERKCITFKGDIKDPDFCNHIIENTIDTFGKLNILVNNAGTHIPQDQIGEVSNNQLENTFETNFFSFFYLSREAVKQMKEGDTIINTTSVTAYKGHPFLLDYSSTKGAVVSFTRALANNLACKGIRINAVAPGPIYTPLVVAAFEDTSKFGQNTPMGRAGQPAEVAPAFVYLASEDSSYMTGQVLHINGGQVMNS